MVSTVASQQIGPRFETLLGQGLFLQSLHVLPVSWVLFGYCGFLLLSKNTKVSFIGHSKLSVRVTSRVYATTHSMSARIGYELTHDCVTNKQLWIINE